jgi:hypothetical protein
LEDSKSIGFVNEACIARHNALLFCAHRLNLTRRKAPRFRPIASETCWLRAVVLSKMRQHGHGGVAAFAQGLAIDGDKVYLIARAVR